jgi:hypothetical protein
VDDLVGWTFLKCLGFAKAGTGLSSYVVTS